MAKFALIMVIIVLNCLRTSTAEAAVRYGIARSAAPVLNTPEMTAVFGGRDGKTLKADRCGQVRALEFIALPGTAFRLLAELRQGATLVYRVETSDYPAPPGIALYVDSRLIETHDTQPQPRSRELPKRDEIVASLNASLGSPYVWGGNLRPGVAEMLEIYYRGNLDAEEVKRLTLAGLDCSGLLYAATNGWTPRNTSNLLLFGQGLAIAGKGAAELAELLLPLDLIVWDGHVIIVLDRETAIESRLECSRPGHGGVVATPLKKRLAQILRNRRPADTWPSGGKQQDVFLVRRWFVP